MKFGLKLFSTNTELIKVAREYYDKGDFYYIELSAIIDTYDEELLSYLRGIPIVIHCDVNYKDRIVNFADSKCFETNIKALKEAQRFADYFGSEYIIVHPGHNGTYQAINEILSKVNDPRICVENMPGKTFDLKYECLGKTKDELLKIGASSYCLDIAHAIKAAKTLGIKPYGLIASLNSLNPKAIHISDGLIDSEVDEHLDIGKGNFDFQRILSIIENDVYATLETPKGRLLDNDVKNIRKFRSL